MTQMPIFVLFVRAGVLFDSAFSLWVSLKWNVKINFEETIIRNQEEKKQGIHFTIDSTNNENTLIP